jgi:hypothetical protein
LRPSDKHLEAKVDKNTKNVRKGDEKAFVSRKHILKARKSVAAINRGQQIDNNIGRGAT